MRLDKMILRELVGPWAFGVAMFTVLLMAGQFLFRLTGYFVGGADFWMVMQLTGLLLPGVLAKTFTMAVLLGTLLAFGRLSSDSEIVALKAVGASMTRIVIPAGIFSFGVALLTFAFNELVVPPATFRALELQTEIMQRTEPNQYRPTSYAHVEHGRLMAVISAADFSIQQRALRRVTVTFFNENGEPTFFLYAREMEYHSPDDWRIRGGGTVVSADGETEVHVRSDAWPGELPPVRMSLQDLIAATLRDLDTLSMGQMREQIERGRVDGTLTPKQLANLEYGYWNKIAVPLGAFTFGLLGAPLGVRNQRTGTAAGFWISVIIIFAYMTVANFMAIYAQGGVIPAYLASFTPVVLGTIFALFAIRKRN
jgi:lipopolysaccharide export system permease protein